MITVVYSLSKQRVSCWDHGVSFLYIFIIQDVPTLFERAIGYSEANVDGCWCALAFFALVNPESTNAINKKLGVQVIFHKFTVACLVGPCEVLSLSVSSPCGTLFSTSQRLRISKNGCLIRPVWLVGPFRYRKDQCWRVRGSWCREPNHSTLYLERS